MHSAETIALVSGGLSFTRDSMFHLSDAEVDTLLGDRRVSLGPEHRIEEPWDDRKPIPNGVLCLALRESWTGTSPRISRQYTSRPKGWILDNSSMGGLDDPEAYARNMWLTRFELEPFGLSLLDSRSLGELLSQIASSPAETTRRSEDWLPGVERHVLPEALAAAMPDGSYSGAWTVCSCGLWEDSSSFLWMFDHRPLLRVDIASMSVFRVELLPSLGTAS